MSFLKKLLKGCGILFGIIIILSVVTAIFGGDVNFSIGNFATSKPFPAPTGPKIITLKCDQKGEQVTLQETLYQSYYDYYQNDSKKKSAYRKNDHAAMIASNEKDSTIKNIAQKIQAIGKSKGLNSDQILDLAACMVQNIPYDQPKANIILSGQVTAYEGMPRKPYETLYDYTAVCTGKTYLGAAIMKEFGYELGVLTFEKEKHMMLGVGVPEGYGSFRTKYGGMELTGVGFKVGTVSELADSGPALNKISKQSSENVKQTSSRELGSPSEITLLTNGNKYQRIIERKSISENMDSLWTSLNQKKPAVEKASQDVSAAEKKLEDAKRVYLKSKSESDYQAYLNEYNLYKSVYNSYVAVMKEYNNLVSQYNTTVESYNIF